VSSSSDAAGALRSEQRRRARAAIGPMQVGRCLFAQCAARTRSSVKGRGALPEGCANHACSTEEADTESPCTCAPADAPSRPALPIGGVEGTWKWSATVSDACCRGCSEGGSGTEGAMPSATGVQPAAPSTDPGDVRSAERFVRGGCAALTRCIAAIDTGLLSPGTPWAVCYASRGHRSGEHTAA